MINPVTFGLKPLDRLQNLLLGNYLTMFASGDQPSLPVMGPLLPVAAKGLRDSPSATYLSLCSASPLTPVIQAAVVSTSEL